MNDGMTFREYTPDEVRKAVSDLMKKGRLLFNNYFGIDSDEPCEMAISDNTLLIRRKEFHFYRLFIQSVDKEDLIFRLNALQGNEYVVNIPSKRPIDDWNKLLLDCGFKALDTYSRYYNNSIRTFPTEINSFATEEEIDAIAELLYSNFSLYTDHLPSKDELRTMIANRQIITDHKDGVLCGAMIFTIKGEKAYENAWIDKGDNGLAILLKAKSIFIQKGVKYCYYWIKDTNIPVIKMHKLLGGKPDGLKDYNYLKNKTSGSHGRVH